jgi:hypothetical protein
MFHDAIMEKEIENSGERPSQQKLSRAWYGALIDEFCSSSSDKIYGRLASNSEFAVEPTQRDAWLEQIVVLKEALRGVEGSLFLEFNIPRMGKRIDAVVIVGPVVFAIEFKVGADTFDRADIEQVWDYALDLKNFHEASHHVSIVPVLVATKVETEDPFDLRADSDDVYHPIKVGANGIKSVIEFTLKKIGGSLVDAQSWSESSYRPTPTIIEAARSLYAQHSVDAIARYDAGAKNLHLTTKRIGEIIDQAMAKGEKVICFVTGVPGAGKTLVGLNVATSHRRELGQSTHATFLSGNGPLVEVLSEALVRDEFIRRKAKGEKVRKGKIRGEVKAFIQIVHHFRDEALKDPNPPNDQVVIFDEAQRAWDLKKTADFMQRKKNQPGFNQSEPDFLIEYMDRHQDWAVIVCLVGGGQEIHTGEAEIDTWMDAIQANYPKWKMYISPKLADSEYAAGNAVKRAKAHPKSNFDESLHLSVSMRSFRAENVSAFVKAILDCEEQEARDAFQLLKEKYPIALTRNLNRAKDWVRSKARGSERFGLVASSKAQRLKPYAIDIRVKTNPIHWFLNDRDDTRSSYYLEDVATEFQVQGLELDWACVTWDGDFRFNGSGWNHHEFRGTKWGNILKPENKNYLLNAYRVLLTRARQGMVIFVPEGDKSDPTRSPEFYDATHQYLADVGIPSLD